MRNSLLQLLEYAIFPAICLVLGKFIGILLISKILDINVNFDHISTGLVYSGSNASSENIILISSYSDLLMVVLIVTLFSANIVRALYFHSSHISPKMTVRLLDRNLYGIVKSSYELYHAAVANLFFLWVASIVATVNSIVGNSYIWIGFVSIGCSVVLTTILLWDVYREVEEVAAA